MKNRRFDWLTLSAPTLNGEQFSDPAKVANLPDRIVNSQSIQESEFSFFPGGKKRKSSSLKSAALMEDRF
jgi:hypothetical protein